MNTKKKSVKIVEGEEEVQRPRQLAPLPRRVRDAAHAHDHGDGLARADVHPAAPRLVERAAHARVLLHALV